MPLISLRRPWVELRKPRRSRRPGSRTLAERIGHTADERLLILNCDDLGCSRSANLTIERALRRGAASSASLMVPCPWAHAAAKSCRDLDVGVHLTLTSEYQAYRWRSLTRAPSLHDKDGYLPATAHEVWARADLADVEKECRAQLDLALEWGIDVTHMNTHMEISQLDRYYFDLYMKLARDYGLPLRLSRASWFWPSYKSRRRLERAGIVTTDNFFAPRWGESAGPAVMERVAGLPRGVTEIVLHPVDNTEELRTYDTEYAEIRTADAQFLMDTRLRDLISASGVRLIGFKPLREVMRGQARSLSFMPGKERCIGTVGQSTGSG